MTSTRITNTLAIGLLAVLGVSACQSDPSPQRVAEDLVKTLTQDHPEIEDCMLEVVESYDLNDLGEKANNENPEISDPALAELDEFEADLVACDPDGITRTSTP